MNGKTVALLLAVVGFASGASADWKTINAHYVEDDTPVVFDTGDSAINVLGKAQSVLSCYRFAANGVLKPSGSGAVCSIKPTLEALDGNLTIDLSEFAFADESSKVLDLQGGVICRGTFTVSGATAVTIGSSVFPPVDIPTVAFNGATLQFVTGVNVYALPRKSAQDWSFADNAGLWLMGDNAMQDLYDENDVFEWPGTTTFELCGTNVFAHGVTVKVHQNQVFRIYPTGPYGAYTDPQTKIVYTDWLSRGGKGRCAVRCDIVLDGQNACLKDELRYTDFYGSITGNGKLQLAGSNGKAENNWTHFYGPVDTTGPVEVYGPSTVSQSFLTYVFHDACFTNGANDLTCDYRATNITLRILSDKSDDRYVPRFKNVSFPAGGEKYVDQFRIQPATNLTVVLETIGAGTCVFEGYAGAGVKIGGITSSTAQLFVESPSTVAKAENVDGSFYTRTDETPKPGATKAYLTCFGGENGVFTFEGYTHAEDITAYGAAKICGAVGETEPAKIDLSSATSAALSTPGQGWDADSKIYLWVDFSDLSTMTQVVATAEPPTYDQGKTNAPPLSGDQLGPKAMNVEPFGSCPQIESFRDRRGEGKSACLLQTLRMYSNKSKGYSEYWQQVYMFAVTNDSNAVRAYVSSGAEKGNTGRRLEFSTRPQSRDVPSITLVFGSQNGGGAGLFADSHGTRIFGRKKGIGNPIMSNETCRVWLNGVEVNPTEATFTGGWDVITVQPKSEYDWVAYAGIGYSRAYTASQGEVDGGGQNYGEIVMCTAKPTDAERIELESYLARKWNISHYNFTTPRVKLDGEVPGDLTVDSGYVIDCGDGLVGPLLLSNYADVLLTGVASGLTVGGTGAISVLARTAIPKFDEGFEGTITLGPDALAVEVPADADPSVAVLDLRPATVKFSGEPKLKVTFPNGAPQPGPYTVLAAGGGLDAAWSYDLPDHTKIKDVTATSVILKVYNGLVIFFR